MCRPADTPVPQQAVYKRTLMKLRLRNSLGCRLFKGGHSCSRLLIPLNLSLCLDVSAFCSIVSSLFRLSSALKASDCFFNCVSHLRLRISLRQVTPLNFWLNHFSLGSFRCHLMLLALINNHHCWRDSRLH